MQEAPRNAKKQKAINPIQQAVRLWADTLPPRFLSDQNIALDHLLSSAPKRWTTYSPMVLLPCGSFRAEWSIVLPSDATSPLSECQKDQLWILILSHIAKKEGKGSLSHLAVNSAIPHESSHLGSEKTENILRTPSGLIPLYGDFGPILSPHVKPRKTNFADAFWVKTKQNGITQVWAPRYTMFSRGNIKEKARLLKFHHNDPVIKEGLRNTSAVDLYAGIGYFVFSYVKMGSGRIFGWELNPWSVEGLRRGAVANGWSIKIVYPGENFVMKDEKIIMFLENNNMAYERLSGLEAVNVLHVNCGLLPTSSASWKMALEILGDKGWLHLHDNVGIHDISCKRLEIERTFKQWLSNSFGNAKVTHVELVKTFAPAVWHCVFDIYVDRRSPVT